MLQRMLSRAHSAAACELFVGFPTSARRQEQQPSLRQEQQPSLKRRRVDECGLAHHRVTTALQLNAFGLPKVHLSLGYDACSWSLRGVRFLVVGSLAVVRQEAGRPPHSPGAALLDIGAPASSHLCLRRYVATNLGVSDDERSSSWLFRCREPKTERKLVGLITSALRPRSWIKETADWLGSPPQSCKG